MGDKSPVPTEQTKTQSSLQEDFNLPSFSDEKNPFHDIKYSEALTAEVPVERLVYDVPAWQQDSGDLTASRVAARARRMEALNALRSSGFIGIILDETNSVVEGSHGWHAALAATPALTLDQNKLKATSVSSQNDFNKAINRLKLDPGCSHSSIVLRDLDGWASEIVRLSRLGNENPDCVMIVLPKPARKVGAAIKSLGASVGLTKRQLLVVEMLLQGKVDAEIAGKLSVDISSVKAETKTILHKFRVRRKSDLIRLLERMP